MCSLEDVASFPADLHAIETNTYFPDTYFVTFSKSGQTDLQA